MKGKGFFKTLLNVTLFSVLGVSSVKANSSSDTNYGYTFSIFKNNDVKTNLSFIEKEDEEETKEFKSVFLKKQGENIDQSKLLTSPTFNKNIGVDIKNHNTTCWDEAAKYHKVDPWLLYAIAYVESRFNPNAIGKNKNGTRDIGLMQINDKVWLPKLNKIGITKEMLKDPCVSVYVGAWILRQNINEFGYTKKAIGAYHSRTPRLNKAYSDRVYAAYNKLTKLHAKENKKQ